MKSAIERPAATEDLLAAAERRTAVRALLRSPLLCIENGDADVLRLVKRHRAELTRVFAEALGYRLVVEPSAARLFKAGLGRDDSHPLRRRSGSPFTPRAYALLCLTVAALTQSKNQLLVDELVAKVRSVAVDAGIDVDLDAVADRRALHAALMALVSLGVLTEREGDLEHWAESAGVLSLLDVRRDRLGLLISAPLASCTSVDDLLDVASVPSAAGGARVAIRRRLVETPVLSQTDLVADQLEWWRRNRNREREWFRDTVGLVVELRAEGAVAIDPDHELTDLEFPGTGSTRQVALLLLERLVDHVRAEAREAEIADRVWRPIRNQVVEAAITAVLAEWGAGLRKDLRDDPTAALREAAEVLTLMRLARIEADGTWHVHAAAARYAVRPALAAAAASGEASLFDEEGQS
jgi:uncharacterized protein (TIGR02678 family)